MKTVEIPKNRLWSTDPLISRLSNQYNPFVIQIRNLQTSCYLIMTQYVLSKYIYKVFKYSFIIFNLFYP